MTAIWTREWTEVCSFEDLEPERGVAALVGGDQVAVFRTHDGAVYAVSNYDPCSGAYVLSRGIVGTRGQAPTVASPMFKDVYDLRTGECFGQPNVVIRTYAVSCTDGIVRVAARDPS